MDYTTANANVTHAGTGHRMHEDSAPIPTEVSAKDMNQVMWGLMKLLEDASVSAASFNPDNVNTYNRISLAVQAIAAGAVPPPSYPVVEHAIVYNDAVSGATWSVSLTLGVGVWVIDALAGMLESYMGVETLSIDGTVVQSMPDRGDPAGVEIHPLCGVAEITITAARSVQVEVTAASGGTFPTFIRMLAHKVG